MQYIRTFSEIGIDDVATVGGKNASLGEMYQSLTGAGVKVPNGFATTADAFWHFLDHNKLRQRIDDALGQLDTENLGNLARVGGQVRDWVLAGEIPPDLAEEIADAYSAMEREHGEGVDVAVRSSATAEDLPNASFAGQQETYLNVRGHDSLMDACRRVFASLFTDRAISYRVHQGFSHHDVALSIGVQKMVRSDVGAAGVMFTLDTETGFRDVVFITSAYGLGENVVQGQVNPDEFYVYKKTLEQGCRPILKRQLGEKAVKMVYTDDTAVGSSTRNVDVSVADRARFSLTDDEVLQLAHYAVLIENHYSERAGQPRPMDIEWGKDGNTGELFILQARPETVESVADRRYQETFQLKERGKVITEGKSIGRKIAAGKARVILSAEHMQELKKGEVLVTDITDPDWEPVMKKAAAIVTNRGGRTCHAAIVARELGIPAVVGTDNATECIASGREVTVSCAEGDTGYIYEGVQQFDVNRVRLDEVDRPQTKIVVNVGNPAQAFEFSALPCDGVGLARLEFIINNSIRIHPSALLHYDRLDTEVQKEIDRLTAGYPDRRSFYVQKLAEGVGMIGAAFHPRPVIVRMSDFKSNEYASLIGGEQFEPQEENPMLGFRGAGRYFSDQFAECFAMECEAMTIVREDMGLGNVALMIPFARSVDEADKVLGEMAKRGLERGKNGLKVYLMCEIPANAILADRFLEHFDGFSIGSNDLTQLTLGVDRDSGIVTGFDERNEAVLALMEMAIEACHRHDKYVGICGQAPSDYPEITRWLVEHRIGSISLNPDSVVRMTGVVLEMEQQLRN
ncbi:MAG: phosphoenolpyruvate synthase [Gammaproteobacteria bacterium]